MSANAPPPTPEPAKTRGYRRLLNTVSLLRSGARDTEEAEIYLNEEKRLAKLLGRMTQPEAQAVTAAMTA